tara:strand:+ start:2117 stop:2290 length:174 start_codon:yes stop_codon:yes gene_type:complete
MDKDLDALAFRLIWQIADEELAKDLTAAVSDAIMAKYKKGLDDGLAIGNRWSKNYEK